MTGTTLSYYLAFLLQTGSPATVAHHAAAPAKPVTPAPAIITIEQETRRGGPAVPLSQSIGSGFVFATADTTAVSAATADEVVDQVQKFYADIKQVSAKFRQINTNATFGRTTTQDGKVWIKKPGKMRWDYYSKPRKKNGKKVVDTLKNFISNGTYLYVVEHQNKQVVEKDLSKNVLPVAVTFLYGKGDLKTDFTAALDNTGTYGDKTKGDIVLALTPKQTSTQYKTLYLVVDGTNYHVKESVIVDGSDNVNHFKFYEPDFDSTVKDKLFAFNKKSVPNYRIITDDDSSDDAGKDSKGE